MVWMVSSSKGSLSFPFSPKEELCSQKSYVGESRKRKWWGAVFGLMLTCLHSLERPLGFFSPHFKVSLVSLRNGVAGTELFVGVLSRPPPCCLAMGNSFHTPYFQFSSLGNGYNKVIIVGEYYHLKRKGRVWVLIFTPVTLIIHTSTYIIESVCHMFFCCTVYLDSFAISCMKNCGTYQMQFHFLTSLKQFVGMPP